jgi:hypothetical protein
MNEKEARIKFAAAAILILVFLSMLVSLREEFCLLRHTPPVGFMDKWYNDCNLVAAGDSRTTLSIDPDQLVKNKKFRGVNFGFNGNALSENYLNKINMLLSPRKPNVIVFGITPHMFVPHAFKDNEFLHYKPPSIGERIFSWSFGSKWHTFSIMTVNEIRYYLTGGDFQLPMKMIRHSNGWLAASENNSDDESKTLKDYERHFQFGPVKPDVMQQFFDRVKKWSSKGIVIIGFRPPTTENMVKLENRLSGFDESEFVQKFEQAGGYWINVPQYNVYRCYDGSHITAGSAKDLSDKLCAEICSRIPQLKSTLCAPDNG